MSAASRDRRKTDWETDEPDDGTWYHAIRRALVDSGEDTVEVREREAEVWRLGSGFITAPDTDSRNRRRRAADVTLPAGPLRPLHPWSGPNAGSHRRSWEGAARRRRRLVREVALSPLASASTRTGASGAASWCTGCCRPCPAATGHTVKQPPAATCLATGVARAELTATVTEIIGCSPMTALPRCSPPRPGGGVDRRSMIDPPQADRFGLSGQIDRLLVTDQPGAGGGLQDQSPAADPGSMTVPRRIPAPAGRLCPRAGPDLSRQDDRVRPAVDGCAGTHGHSASHAGCAPGPDSLFTSP